MTVGQWLRQVHVTCGFMSRERPGRASNSELHRWIVNGAVVLNGTAHRDPAAPVPELTHAALFPKGRTITLWEV